MIARVHGAWTLTASKIWAVSSERKDEVIVGKKKNIKDEMKSKDIRDMLNKITFVCAL